MTQRPRRLPASPVGRGSAIGRTAALSIALLVLICGLAFADPGISVTYFDGIMRVRLEGSYPGSYYQIWRSDELLGQVNAVTAANVVCTGDCLVNDPDYVPGHTYYYRFDLTVPGQGFVSYGPYAVTVPDTPFAARLWPNPGTGVTHIELSLPGGRRDAPLEVEARILDLQGRVVRSLHRGPLPRGVTSVTWDGRGDAGQRLGAGLYFLRFSSELGGSTTRVTRFR